MVYRQVNTVSWVNNESCCFLTFSASKIVKPLHNLNMPSISGTRRYWQCYERTPVAWPTSSAFPGDFVAIAELKIFDGRDHDWVLSDWQSGSVRELEAACRRRLRCYLPVVADMWQKGKLLPLKFDNRFYDWTMMLENNGSLRSHQVLKSQWSIMKSLLLIKQWSYVFSPSTPKSFADWGVGT